MATFSEYYRRYTEDAYNGDFIRGGLGMTFFNIFSAVPAGIGHVLDALFGLEGSLFEAKPDKNFHGPFGFALGIIPALAGYVIGQAVRLVIDLPVMIGWGLDKVITGIFWLARGGFDEYSFRWDQALGAGYGQVQPQWLSMLCALLSSFASNMLKAPEKAPETMYGVFSFLFGLVPQIASRLFVVFTGVVVALINVITDVPRQILTFVKSEFTMPIQEKKQASQGAARGGREKRRPRVRLGEDLRKERAAQHKAEAEVDSLRTKLDAFKSEGVNLFDLLGLDVAKQKLTKGSVERAYRFRIANMRLHSDKLSDFYDKFTGALEDTSLADNALFLKTILGLSDEEIGQSKTTFSTLGENELNDEQKETLKEIQGKGSNRVSDAKSILLDSEFIANQYLEYHSDKFGKVTSEIQFASQKMTNDNQTNQNTDKPTPHHGPPISQSRGSQVSGKGAGRRRRRRIRVEDDSPKQDSNTISLD